MNTSLTDKWAVVTGASKGIGQAIAKKFFTIGSNVRIVL